MRSGWRQSLSAILESRTLRVRDVAQRRAHSSVPKSLRRQEGRSAQPNLRKRHVYAPGAGAAGAAGAAPPPHSRSAVAMSLSIFTGLVKYSLTPRLSAYIL